MSSIIGSNEILVFFHKFKNALVCLLLVAAVVTAYHRLPHNDFVAFDDNKLIYNNPQIKDGLSWENIKWAFTTNYFSNWHPLTWLSLMLDYELYGLEPWGYHRTALILHALNAIVLYFALLRLTRPHPLPPLLNEMGLGDEQVKGGRPPLFCSFLKERGQVKGVRPL